MGINIPTVFGLALCLPGVTVAASVQERTIPELLAATTHDIGALTEVEFGIPPPLESVIKLTDVIVRGTIEGPRVFLSKDEKLVYSEFEISEPQILHDPNNLVSVDASGSPGSVKFVQIGGTVNMYGRRYTLTHDNLRPLTPGSDYLLLLEQTEDGLQPAGRYFGAFRFAEDKLVPMNSNGSFAPDVRDYSANDALMYILGRAHALRR